MGEFRASVPLIKELLGRSERIILTTITPAGREEAQGLLRDDVDKGNLHIAYLPLEYDFAFNKFISSYRPRFAIVLEYELWPVMIASCVRNRVPLVLAQGQYIEKSFLFDKKWPSLRGALLKGFDLILAKSELHSSRYREFTEGPVETMGELRFDQEIPMQQIAHAKLFLKEFKKKNSRRSRLCFGSTGPGEDDLLINLMKRMTLKATSEERPKPFYIYVPRHKKDFLKIQQYLKKSGLNFLNRTDLFDKNLKFNIRPSACFEKADGLLGDSLGEINFYFQLADYVFIGNSLNNLGCHNVIEPLALKKRVVVGPSVWGIEYPVVEALAAGVITIVKSSEELYQHWQKEIIASKKASQTNRQLNLFCKSHSGATRRCIGKLKKYQFLPKSK